MYKKIIKSRRRNAIASYIYYFDSCRMQSHVTKFSACCSWQGTIRTPVERYLPKICVISFNDKIANTRGILYERNIRHLQKVPFERIYLWRRWELESNGPPTYTLGKIQNETSNFRLSFRSEIPNFHPLTFSTFHLSNLSVWWHWATVLRSHRAVLSLLRRLS